MTWLRGISDWFANLPANVRGALFMLASSFTFTLMTTLIKYLGDDYSPALQAFYRQIAGVVILAPIILRNPVAAFATTRPGVLIFRSAAGVLGMVLAFYAYQEMNLADANALSFTRTLWIVPLAIFVLHERVGPRRLIATLAGFAGVLLMLQPSVENSVGLPALAALASALLFAGTITGMKVMTRDHSLLVLMSWAAVLGLVLAAPLALLEWRWPTPIDLALLCAMGALGLVNQALYIKGMAIGDAAAMAPIDYSRLVFAIVIGLLVFDEAPNPLAMAGAVIVIASTLYITWREARLRKPPPPLVDE